MRITRNILSAVAIAVVTATSFDSVALAASSAGKVKAASIVQEEARAAGVPTDLALAMARVESNFNCRAVGRAGERGIMQIKPTTARGIGYKGTPSGLSDCRTGARWGMKYLKQALNKAGGSYCRAAALYNQGLGMKKMTRGGKAYCAATVALTKRYGANTVAITNSTVTKKRR